MMVELDIKTTQKIAALERYRDAPAFQELNKRQQRVLRRLIRRAHEHLAVQTFRSRNQNG